MKAKQVKQVEHGFRVVVRGTTKVGKKTLRVRRVRTVHCTDISMAALLAEQQDKRLLDGISNYYVAVLPPLVR
jgi:ribosomal protein L34